MSYLVQKRHVIQTFFFLLFLSLLFFKFCFAPGWLIILLIFYCRNNFTRDQLDLISLAIYFSNNKVLPSNSIMLRMFHMFNIAIEQLYCIHWDPRMVRRRSSRKWVDERLESHTKVAELPVCRPFWAGFKLYLNLKRSTIPKKSCQTRAIG